MITRRRFLQYASLLTGGSFMGHVQGRSLHSDARSDWHMPDESAPHKRTWMCFIASYNIWGERQVPEVHRNLATIAKTVAKYEPVSMLVSREDYAIAVELLGGLDNHAHPIELIECTLNDLWMRDTGPAFVVNGQGGLAAVDFNFNGWGEKQDYEFDAKVADFVAQEAGARSIESSLVLEGGCFELDGQGTAIMTESCILNDNRNPGRSKADAERELKALLGLDKIIWLKGIKGKDITDGHTDFYARFAKPGVIVVGREMDGDSFDYNITRENIEILEASTDAQGNSFEIIVLDTPWDINTRYGTEYFAAGYVGYYVCNGAIIMQKFGDKQADSAAKRQLQRAFPNHRIEQLAVDGLASGGGSIHCATQQEPRV